MPAQNRPAPSPSDQLLVAVDDHQQQGDGNQLSPVNPPEEQDGSSPDSDAEGCNSSSPSAAEKDEYILVKLADIRREVQCPICLGIIRKTRTVMECLHRFCRECIDKSMRLGNNECPACRTHCASRRSLRDDPNYDAFIATLYPDIDEYEEEELAFHEEEKIRNQKIQESIDEIFRRQTEALGRKRSSAKATAADFVRKSKGNFRSRFLRGRGRNGGHETELICSDDDDDEEDASGNEDSSAGERSPEVRQKRCKRLLGSWASPVRTDGNSDVGCEENEDPEMSRENLGMCAGHREMLTWGKVAARSQTRHGSLCGFSSRNFKGGRMGKLLEHLRSSNANDNEFDVHLTLLPMDEQSTPLEQPHLCCRPTLSVRHLSHFIATCTSAQVEQVEILVRKPHGGTLPFPMANSVDKALNDPSEELRILGLQESLAGLHAYFTSERGDLVLLYRLKIEL